MHTLTCTVCNQDTSPFLPENRISILQIALPIPIFALLFILAWAFHTMNTDRLTVGTPGGSISNCRSNSPPYRRDGEPSRLPWLAP
jgi:hypothetical protein